MNEQKQTDWKRVIIFTAIAFAIAWAASLYIYQRGGILDSPELVEDSGLTEAVVIMATVVMFAPTLAHLLTRLFTREGWQDLWISFNLKRGWPYILMAWLGTPLLIAVGTVIYFVFFPRHFDPNMTAITEMSSAIEMAGTSPGLFIAIQIFTGILISPVLNLVPIFGEEFGWRGYLVPKLLPLGERKAYIISGAIWGLWHAPIILMGYNYGTDYPCATWSGALMFIFICFVLGTFFGWASVRAGSIWPGVFGHAVLNGTATASLFFAFEGFNPLLGPAMMGIIGSLGFTLITIWIFLRGIPEPQPEEA